MNLEPVGSKPALKSCVWFTRKKIGWGYDHNWPSNFFIEPDGTCVEVEFQVEKHRGHPWRQRIIRRAKSPGEAKKLGRKWKLTSTEKREWEQRKNEVMFDLIAQKIDDWPEIEQTLLDTGDGIMVEYNWWHDDYWGSCQCQKHYFRIGRNELGKIWMRLREQLQNSG